MTTVVAAGAATAEPVARRGSYARYVGVRFLGSLGSLAFVLVVLALGIQALNRLVATRGRPA